MEEPLLSKKELLEQTGISYGQLYRWKRMNIIPESWFIKRSSYTGQETFFPKERILERVSKIIELKDDFSLDELANFFSPNPSDIELAVVDIQINELVKKETIQLFEVAFPNLDRLSFNHVFLMYICEIVSATNLTTLEKAFRDLAFIQKLDYKKGNVSLQLLAIQKSEEIVWILIPLESTILLEEGARLGVKISILEHLNELKIKLSGLNK